MVTSDYTSKDIQRFWNKVNKNGSIPTHCPELGQCWEWTASTKPFGYGQFNLRKKNLNAHKISWELNYGDTKGLHVLHKCDNPKCVNPDHLFLGTDTDNVRDMHAKNRQASPDKTAHLGESNGFHKLTDEKVRYIRRRFLEGNISISALAREIGVSTTTASRAISGQRWVHVE